MQTSTRLLGSNTTHCNHLRRTSDLQSLNPGIGDITEEDSIFNDAGICFFGEGFTEKTKKREHGLRALDKVSGKVRGNSWTRLRATAVVLCTERRPPCPKRRFFPRAKTQNGKHIHFRGSGRQRPIYGPYPQTRSSRKDSTSK